MLAKANRYAANVVFNIIEPYVPFKSLLDLGCGTGLWMQAALRQSDRKVFGVELEEFEPDELLVPANLVLNASLANPIDLREQFDLVICLETAEHIDADHARTVVENCTRHSSVVLFSAAIPGQEGIHHVNEQNPEYWIGLFDEIDFEVVDFIRPQIWLDASVPVWYRQNMLLFVRRDRAELIHTLKSTVASFETPMSRVHPDLFRANQDRARNREQSLSGQVSALQAEFDQLRRALADSQRLAADRVAEAQQLKVAVDQLNAQLSSAEQRLEAERADLIEAQRRLGTERAQAKTTERLLASAVQSRLDTERQLDKARNTTHEVRAELAALEGHWTRSLNYFERLRLAASEIATRYEEAQLFSQDAGQQLHAIHKSTSWRLTALARWTSSGLKRAAGRASTSGFSPRSLPEHQGEMTLRGLVDMLEDAETLRPAATNRLSKDDRIRITFVSGEPNTPGHAYRIHNMAKALPDEHYDVVVIGASELAEFAETIERSAVLWIWRAPWSADLSAAIESARMAGAKIVFDVDDLMFRPDLATSKVIDGIRSQGFSEGEIAAFYERIRATMVEADLCVTTTLRLAREIISAGKPAAVIPNGYAFGAQQAAAEAVSLAAAVRADGLFRIGYAAGTRTHQRDFSLIVPALSKVLASHANVRLVLTHGTIDVSEFPTLLPFGHQIEWREFVPLERMLSEYARYDINVVPLEVGNRFCEAKSELKFFEAALVGVPTIASPTEPYAAAMRHGETGLLADGDEAWYDAIMSLVDDAGLGQRIAAAARREVLWNYGPERRAYSVRRTIGRLLSEPVVAAGLFQAQLADDVCQPLASIQVPEYDIVYQRKSGSYSRVAVIMPCYNYANYIEEALNSVLMQTYKEIDIVIVDDCSTDNSVEVARNWLKEHGSEFNKVTLLKNRVNSKLGASRNAAISFAETELFLPLDPDNVLMPDCIESCLDAIDSSGAAVAYPKIESFGDTGGQTWYLSEPPWQPDRFRSGNYIDAMALIRTNCWAAVGGYEPFLYGWEDYELWCRFVERGFFGVNVAQVTAMYRYHGNQMIKTLTQKSTKPLLDEMRSRHPWTYPNSD